jgi:hypothetical protein
MEIDGRALGQQIGGTASGNADADAAVALVGQKCISGKRCGQIGKRRGGQSVVAGDEPLLETGRAHRALSKTGFCQSFAESGCIHGTHDLQEMSLGQDIQADIPMCE